MTPPVVAHLKAHCRICGFSDELRTAINKAIWTEPLGPRVSGYRLAGVRVALDHAVRIDAKTVTRHAAHVESAWRTPTIAAPPSGSEVDVFDVSLDAMTERAGKLGARALATLESRLGGLAGPELVQVAKLGVTAVERREALRLKDRRPNINLMALFGLVSGHVPDSARLEEVVPLRTLEAELDAERGSYAVRVDD